MVQMDWRTTRVIYALENARKYRLVGGELVMIQAALFAYRTSRLKNLKEKQKVKICIEVFQEISLPFFEKHKKSVTFQQDIVSTLRASLTKRG